MCVCCVCMFVCFYFVKFDINLTLGEENFRLIMFGLRRDMDMIGELRR